MPFAKPGKVDPHPKLKNKAMVKGTRFTQPCSSRRNQPPTKMPRCDIPHSLSRFLGCHVLYCFLCCQEREPEATRVSLKLTATLMFDACQNAQRLAWTILWS